MHYFPIRPHEERDCRSPSKITHKVCSSAPRTSPHPLLLRLHQNFLDHCWSSCLERGRLHSFIAWTVPKLRMERISTTSFSFVVGTYGREGTPKSFEIFSRFNRPCASTDLTLIYGNNVSPSKRHLQDQWCVVLSDGM